jgi:hypothetical protein
MTGCTRLPIDFPSSSLLIPFSQHYLTNEPLPQCPSHIVIKSLFITHIIITCAHFLMMSPFDILSQLSRLGCKALDCWVIGLQHPKSGTIVIIHDSCPDARLAQFSLNMCTKVAWNYIHLIFSWHFILYAGKRLFNIYLKTSKQRIPVWPKRSIV